MRRLSIAVIAAASTIALAQIASAADMPVKAPRYVPPAPPPPYSWTGFYIGASIGGGSQSATGTDQAPSLILDTPGTQYDISGSGGVFGGYVGYNYQMGALVYGIEADLAYSTIDGTITVPSADPPRTGMVSASLDYLGTVRGRIGYAFDYLLIYATGGFAYGRINDWARDEDVDRVQLSGTQSGWTVGGGIEYAISKNFVLRGEGLYVDLGNHTSSQNPDGGFFNFKNTYAIGRAGLAYKF
jgi:outer membrane immunogenic protein